MSGWGYLAAAVGGYLLMRSAGSSLPAPQASPHDLAKPLSPDTLKPLADSLLPAYAGAIGPSSLQPSISFLNRSTPVEPGQTIPNPDPTKYAVARDWTGQQALVSSPITAPKVPLLPAYSVPAAIRTDQRGLDAQVESKAVRSTPIRELPVAVSSRPSVDARASLLAKKKLGSWCDDGACVPGGWMR